jgi:DNA-binding response OmpR family regulator
MEQQSFPGVLSSSFPPTSEPEYNPDSTQKLSLHLRYPEIDLASVPIDEAALRHLPLEVMRQYQIVPFEFNMTQRLLKVACRTPHDRALIDALSQKTKGLLVELYTALPTAIDETLARLIAAGSTPLSNPPDHAPLVPMPTERQELFDLPAIPTEPMERPIKSPAVELTPDPVEAPTRGQLLFLAPQGRISEHLMFALSAEQYRTRVTGSIDAATEQIADPTFDHLFIHESFRSAATPLLEKIEQTAPTLSVRFYASEASLLVADLSDRVTDELMTRNLQLFRHLGDTPLGPLFAHAAAVGQMADRLAVRFKLPTAQRHILMTAASLHNLAEKDVADPSQYTPADLIGLSAGKLSRWGYPASVSALLRDMYREAAEPTATTPHQSAANILTAADLFAHYRPGAAPMNAEDCCHFRKTFRQAAKRYVTNEVLDALLNLVADENKSHGRANAPFAVHLFSLGASFAEKFEEELACNAFTVSHSHSLEECVQACKQNPPQALLIKAQGSSRDLYDAMLSLALRGVTIDQIFTILLVDESSAQESMGLLRHGVEDVLPATVPTDALMTKLSRLRNRLEERAQSRHALIRELGTHGSLEDMNLIDLLEASRANSRPVHISVSANGQHLTVVIDKGSILVAEGSSRSGIDAIQEAIGWKQGVWSIDPVDPAELPEATLDQNIDSVLLEACVNHDQALRA